MFSDADLARRVQGRVGTTIRGKYRIDAVLGVGGMAVVYAATHRNQAEFAIKMLHPELSLSHDLCKRFLREGYAANSVKHPGVVQVVDDDVTEDGAAFLVMERLRGVGLEVVWQQRGGMLPDRGVVAILDELLGVLAAAHEKGIVHRDIKPSNLFITHDGTVKVLDFGIARARDAAAHATGAGHATGTGMVLGTPAYMAPEQALGKSLEIAAQTDLWAAGATFFSLVTGKTVHPGENAPQLLVLAATARARSLSITAPHVPKAIADVIDRALAFECSARWPSATAMRDALREAHMAVYGGAPTRVPLDAMYAINASALASTQAMPTPPRVPGTWPTPIVPSDPGAPAQSGGEARPWGEQSLEATTAAPVSAAHDHPPSPAPAMGVPPARSRRRSRIALGAAALVALLVAGGVGLRALNARHAVPNVVATATPAPDDTASAATASRTPANTATASPPNAIANTAADPAKPSPNAAPPRATIPQPTPSAQPTRPPRPLHGEPPSPAAAVAHPSARPPSCTPPYFFDAAGNRVFKKECL